MIDIVKQTPEYYNSESRDFQFLARLYTIIFNSIKMYIDINRSMAGSTDEKLVDLKALSLNFRADHQWDRTSLAGALSCFKYLLRDKGTEKALEACISLLLRVEGIYITSEYSKMNHVRVSNDGTQIEILVPESLSSVGVVEDLLKYLLPAGVSYTIRKYDSVLFDTLVNIKTDSSNFSYLPIEESKLGINIGDNSYKTAEGNKGYTIYHNDVNTLEGVATIGDEIV